MSSSRTTLLLATLIAVIFGVGCSDAASGPGSPLPRITHSVAVTPATKSIGAGQTLALEARALDRAGEIISGRAVIWRSSNDSVAIVSAAGVVTARAVGTVTITATVDEKVGIATLVVTPLLVASIGITPGAFVLDVGQTRQLTAILRDEQGNLLTGRQVTWSSDSDVASISTSGLVTALAPGYVGFTATSEGRSTTVAATIVAEEPLEYDLLYTKESGTNTNEIYLLDFTGTPTPVRINAGTVSRQPTASPNGSRIAFAVSQTVLGTNEEIHDIFAVDRTGLNMKRLTTSDAFEDSPAWSPDGTKIAYRSMTLGTTFRSDIYLMNTDGSGQVNLTGDLQTTGMLASPAWSPDGTRIAYASSVTNGAETRNGIWTMNADGSGKREITSTLTGFDAMPSWSPDGTRIVFMRYFAGEGDLAIITLASGQVTRISLPGLQMSPVWSPDGRFIAFTNQLGPQSVIYTIFPNGSGLHLRTTNRAWGDAWFPAWIARR